MLGVSDGLFSLPDRVLLSIRVKQSSLYDLYIIIKTAASQHPRFLFTPVLPILSILPGIPFKPPQLSDFEDVSGLVQWSVGMTILCSSPDSRKGDQRVTVKR